MEAASKTLDKMMNRDNGYLFISELKRDDKVHANMERLVPRTCLWANNLTKNTILFRTIKKLVLLRLYSVLVWLPALAKQTSYM